MINSLNEKSNSSINPLAHYRSDELVIITDWSGKIELYNNLLSQLCNSANKDEILNVKVKIDKLFRADGIDFNKVFNSVNKHGHWSGKLIFILNFNQIIPFDAKVLLLSSEPESNLKYLFRLELIEVDEFERDPVAQRDEMLPMDVDSYLLSVEDSFAAEPYEELKRMKDDFLSSVSHELRTPLASIIGFTETIKNDPQMPSNVRGEFVDIIFNEGKRLASLINDLLNISDLEKRNVKLELKEHLINNIVTASFNNYKSIADEKYIDFNLVLPNSAVISCVDAEKIQQLTSNLISNALKFTPTRGKVVIELKSSESDFIITITDTGIGIPKKDLNRIFNKFYRVYRPGFEFRGTGLGLTICQAIAQLHGGNIIVESELSSGTTFTVRIPIRLGEGRSKG
ncbi:MAG: HAMP domain-containing histidine kinase [Ignavibacteria bacterium]|nr:HAMP domain-containing histidine kinase [Ignavibacteria bacterium]